MDTQHGILRAFTRAVSDNSPTILSAIAAVGVGTTVVLAVKATPKAIKAVHNAKIVKLDDVSLQEVEEGCLDGIKLSPGELVQATWRAYAPAALAGAMTITCIVGANKMSLNRNAAAIAAYGLLDRTLHEYREEVIERIGTKDNDEIEERIVEKKVQAGPGDAQVFIAAGGEQLCFEGLSGRYFQSDIESIRKAANDIVHGMLTNTMYFSLNEWFDALGLPPIDLGDELGWSIENQLEVKFSSHIAGDGRPCLAVRYANLPRKDYGDI